MTVEDEVRELRMLLRGHRVVMEQAGMRADRLVTIVGMIARLLPPAERDRLTRTLTELPLEPEPFTATDRETIETVLRFLTAPGRQ